MPWVSTNGTNGSGPKTRMYEISGTTEYIIKLGIAIIATFARHAGLQLVDQLTNLCYNIKT